ncbi:MAG: formyltransferase family protein [Fervidobacterium sp.]
MKTCLLSSGGGGNLKFFYLGKKMGILKNIDVYLITDRECGALYFAHKVGIYAKKITYKRTYNKELLEELERLNPDIIIGSWHKIIDKEVVQKYYGRLINLHYSLLPAFGGLIGLEQIIGKAYEMNCQYIGCTCHFIDENVDSGKIIAQAIIKVDIPINEAIQKVFEKGCLILLNSILIITNDHSIIERTQNDKFDYSPSLLFDDSLFDKEFWKQVAKL